MRPIKAARAARCSTSGDPRKFAHTGKRRNFLAIIPRSRFQAERLDPAFVPLGAVAARVVQRLAEKQL
jgi:hypothetical protein